jgi:hypothetical protein
MVDPYVLARQLLFALSDDRFFRGLSDRLRPLVTDWQSHGAVAVAGGLADEAQEVRTCLSYAGCLLRP